MISIMLISKTLKFQSSLWSYILCPSFFSFVSKHEHLLFQSSLWSYILCPGTYYYVMVAKNEYFNLLYEAIFYVLVKKLGKTIYLWNLFQSSLWSYILCPSKKWEKNTIIAFYFNLLYEAIFYVLEKDYQKSKAATRISIFFMKLYSMSCYLHTGTSTSKKKFQSSLWSYILCPLLRSEICPPYPRHFNLLYEAIFYVLNGNFIRPLKTFIISIFFMKLYSMSFQYRRW